uniref:Uncharacterized protein n=1 Tax=Lepeophtheirus salmonis TaxID=72036 RepID=A0A0K2UJP6_LEPSM
MSTFEPICRQCCCFIRRKV